MRWAEARSHRRKKKYPNGDARVSRYDRFRSVSPSAPNPHPPPPCTQVEESPEPTDVSFVELAVPLHTLVIEQTVTLGFLMVVLLVITIIIEIVSKHNPFWCGILIS